MKIAIVSDLSQYDAFLKFPGRRDFFVICDNPRFEDRLRADGIQYGMITEYDIRDLWPEINQWGCEVACEMIRVGRAQKIFRSLDMASVIFHHFSRTLVHIRKNHALASFILSRYRPHALWIPNQPCAIFYPDFSGNFFLCYFLERLAMERGISIEKAKIRQVMVQAASWEDCRPLVQRMGSFLVDFFKKMLPSSANRSLLASHQGSILAYGGLNHLGSLIPELTKRGEKIVLFSDLFQKPWWAFSKKNKVAYVQSRHFRKRAAMALGDWADARKNELRNVLLLLRGQGTFRVREYDFFPSVHDLVFSRMDDYFGSIARRYAFCEALFDGLKPKACLAHDDFSLVNGFIAAFARERRVPVFCISHATLALDFSVPVEKRAFCQSVTFVNSEFERHIYETRGWSGGDRIQITGIPRYDRLIRAGKQGEKPATPSGSPLKLLYCATGLWRHSPNQRGFLGSDVNLYRHVQIPAFTCMIEALRGLPVELVIKPHSHIALPLWKEQVAKQGALDYKVTVVSHAVDIFDLYSECHAMLISYWSTALLEAAIIGLPTIFIDPFPPYSRNLYEFSDSGFCEVVNNCAGLRAVIEKLQVGILPGRVRLTPRKRNYYLGDESPVSVQRVTERILAEINKAGSGDIPINHAKGGKI